MGVEETSEYRKIVKRVKGEEIHVSRVRTEDTEKKRKDLN